MPVNYDKYYKTANLFGAPYAELIDFFAAYPKKGKVLDLGCGQGRDALALARLGYSVTGIDYSRVGIEQMNQVARAENLDLVGLTEDVYAFEEFAAFDIVLLDSMLHFTKQDREKEMGLIRKIISALSPGSLLVICIQDTGNKVDLLNQALDFEKQQHRLLDQPFKYRFEDQDSGHTSETNYRMVVIEK